MKRDEIFEAFDTIFVQLAVGRWKGGQGNGPSHVKKGDRAPRNLENWRQEFAPKFRIDLRIFDSWEHGEELDEAEKKFAKVQHIYSRFSRSFTAKGSLLGIPPGYKAN